MDSLEYLLKNNKQWSDNVKQHDPSFFERTAKFQAPKYLWIGCSDSRVAAEMLMQLEPGELFVHRNIANIFDRTDLNFLSVLQFAVEYLKVQHVIVCGHYGCGGVDAYLSGKEYGLIDNWLANIGDVADDYQEELETCASHEARLNLLCELNVKEQVSRVSKTTIVQKVWHNWQKNNQQDLCIHGWVYNPASGIIKDLDVTLCSKNKK